MSRDWYHIWRTSCVCCDLKGSIRCVAGKCDVTEPCIVFKQAFHDVGRSQSMEHSDLGCKGNQMCSILEWNLGKLTANFSGYMVKKYASPHHDGI